MQRSASSASITTRPSRFDATTDFSQGQGQSKLRGVAEDKEINSSEAALATPLGAVDAIQLRPLKDTIRIALQRVGYDDTRVAHLFGLVFPGEYELPPMDNGVLVSGKSHVEELSDVVCRLIKAALASNQVILGFPEAQWMDSASWELLYDVLTYNPDGLPILIFTRLIKTHENEQNNVVYNKMPRHNLTSFDIHTVEGLTLADTHDMVIVSWPGSLIKGVHRDIVEQIFYLSQGMPLFIKFLLLVFQESGQYIIDQDGILTTQGNNFSSTESCPRRVAPIASALGEQFRVDDVFSVFSEAFPKQVFPSIDQNDKYGFLTRYESPSIQEGLTYQFKSDTVRNYIYTTMDDTQRQQLHLNIALNYENRITKNKDMRPALIFPLLEHYLKTDHVMKCIKYMEELAGFYCDHGLVSESLRHYEWLILMVDEYEIDETLCTADTRSDWHRQLAEAYIWKGFAIENSEDHALQALEWLGCPMPTSARRLERDIRKVRRTNEKAWRKEQVPCEKMQKDAEEMDPVHRSKLEAAREIYQKSAKSVRETSRIELVGSLAERAYIADQPRLPLSNHFQAEMRAYLSLVPEHLHSNLFSASPRQYGSSDSDLLDLIARDPKMARQHKVHLTLLILAEINLRLDRPRELMWCITTGLNLSYNFPLKIIFRRFLALWALYLSRYEPKNKLMAKIHKIRDKLSRQHQKLPCFKGPF
ncbi:hypothetical protein DFS34DRAFT_667238 [Phlyctochytrium arcticum]|nr:hypothetical protein DFS34DRAFT_667238 [Phlyctochytrium arcticum]